MSGVPAPMDDVLRYEVADGVATLTLDRPEARNALSSALLRALASAVARAEADADVAVVVLTGADPAFCAGLDLKEMGGGGGALRSGGSGGSSASASAPPFEGRGPLAGLSKPVIGAVNGVAITGGLELALGCSFLVASERARFADTHSRVGVQPGWGLTVLLPAAVGLRRAREMSATGNFIDAPTALAWGLVNHVVPHEELLPFCLRLAADMAGNDAAGVARLLQSYDDNAALSPADAWAHEAAVANAWMREQFSPEAVEARRAAIAERGRAQRNLQG